MIKVIIDTNFMLIPGQFRVDIFSEIERLIDSNFVFCVVSETIKELEGLCGVGKTADRMAAKLGLALIRQKHLKILHSFITNKTADDAIVKKADEHTYVATQDKALRGLLKAKKARIIGLRQKKYLVID